MIYCTPTQMLTARKDHRCANCGQSIQAGATYARWVSFDNSAFTNKMHPECLRSLQDDSEYGEFEYTPYSGERPTA